VLLKPTTDKRAQVIIHGKARRPQCPRLPRVQAAGDEGGAGESWERLARLRLRVVEGAGSPAEINLRDRDIANMGFAEAVDCPVILIADIDRGGVFAHLVGTLDLLSPSEQARVKGFVINRFRGDISLLESGLTWLEERTGKPVLGVLPYLHGLMLDAEDALPLAVEAKKATRAEGRRAGLTRAFPTTTTSTRCACTRKSISAGSARARRRRPADLIVLPGSKAVQADLDWLRARAGKGDPPSTCATAAR
jgi:adenosylcobyric acid synthase